MSNKSGSKKVVLFGGIIVFIVAAALTVLAFTSNAFKSPKQVYLSTEGRYAKKIIENLKEEGAFLGNIKKLSEHSHETEREYSLSIDLDTSKINIPIGGSIDLTSITELLDNSKLVINEKSNPEKNQKITGIDVLINNTKLIDFIAAFENDIFALSIPVVFDKYIVADLSKPEDAIKDSDLKNLYNKLSPAANVITPKGILKSLSFDEKNSDRVKKNYKKVLNESINKEQVSLEKNVPFKVGEFDLKCSKLTIKFEKSDLQRLVANIMDATAESDAVYELTKENIKNIYEFLKNTEYSDELGDIQDIEADFTKEKFKKGINEIKAKLEKAFDNFELPDGINMSIYINKKEIVGRTIDTKFKTPASDNTLNLSVDFKGVSEYKNKNIKNLEIEFGFSGDSSSVSNVIFEYTLDGSIDRGTESGKKHFSIAAGTGGISTKIFKLDADYNVISNAKSNSKESSHDYKISIGVPMMFSVNADGSLTVNTWEKPKEKQFGKDVDFSINLDIPENMLLDKTSLGVGFSSKTKNTLDVEFDFPSFNPENSIDITNASEEEISQLKKEIEESVIKFLQNNEELIKLFQ
ncbi:MAG TPA: hypothetical protein DCE02_03380 [Ruminiclostridium sp.]|nr:hypothetical protein [Ruminiclostridium sp.]